MPAGDVYRCAFEYQVWGQHCVNVLHFMQRGANEQNAQDVAINLRGDLMPLMEGILSNPNTGGIMLRVTLISRTFSDLGEAGMLNMQGVPYPGLAPTLAAVLRFRTAFAGRRHRGRMYVGGAALAQEGGIITGTSATEWGTWASQWLPKFGPEGNTNFILGVFSRTIWRNGTSSITDAWKPVTAVVPDVILGTQRGRRPGVGE